MTNTMHPTPETGPDALDETGKPLRERRWLRTKDLLKYLDISRATLYRDAELLACGSPIGTGRKRSALRFDRERVDLIMAARAM